MDERERLARRTAAFLVWLDNIPPAGHPNRGDPEVAERAAAAFHDPAAAAEAERRGEPAGSTTGRRRGPGCVRGARGRGSRQGTAQGCRGGADDHHRAAGAGR